MLARLRADYDRFSAYRGESRRRKRLLALPRFLVNPELHAVVLVRLASEGPRPLHALWRNVLIAKHGIEAGHGATFGPGLMLPHPHAVYFGPQIRVGARATIYHGVSIGGNEHRHGTATVGDDVTVWPNAMILGPITVGDGAVVGATVYVDVDVAPGAVVKRGVREARDLAARSARQMD